MAISITTTTRRRRSGVWCGWCVVLVWIGDWRQRRYRSPQEEEEEEAAAAAAAAAAVGCVEVIGRNGL
jgi:hypothetical protein